MRTTGIRPGDIVRCDVRGQRFYAHVGQAAHDDYGRGGIWLDPLPGLHVPARRVTARQIIEHYAKRKG